MIYTQACARAAGVIVPLDPAPVTEYPAVPPELARAVLADASIHRRAPVPEELHHQ